MKKEHKRKWAVKKIMVIPIVAGAVGEVSRKPVIGLKNWTYT